MTALLVVGAASFAVSLLTLFTGFGLGTLLMPVFAVFLPVEVAVASTAVVHAANNLFKVGLLARSTPREIVLRFGLPALAASFVGAALLGTLARLQPLLVWEAFGRDARVTPIGLVAGALIVVFSLFELVPALRALRAPTGWLPLGGALSGFFGGLTGHQGALRAIFLTPLGLPPAQFVASQAAIALLVDAARLLVYGITFAWLGSAGAQQEPIPWPLVAAATLCAFAGAVLGKRLLPKVTMAALRGLVGALLLAVGVALALGIA